MAERDRVATILNYRWRTGRKVGRTIYAQLRDEASDADLLIGVMDYAGVAEQVVALHNMAVAAASTADELRDHLRNVGPSEVLDPPADAARGGES